MRKVPHLQVLAAVRVVVKEWARRNGAADGTTTKFIKEVPFLLLFGVRHVSRWRAKHMTCSVGV